MVVYKRGAIHMTLGLVISLIIALVVLVSIIFFWDDTLGRLFVATTCEANGGDCRIQCLQGETNLGPLRDCPPEDAIDAKFCCKDPNKEPGDPTFNDFCEEQSDGTVCGDLITLGPVGGVGSSVSDIPTSVCKAGRCVERCEYCSRIEGTDTPLPDICKTKKGPGTQNVDITSQFHCRVFGGENPTQTCVDMAEQGNCIRGFCAGDRYCASMVPVDAPTEQPTEEDACLDDQLKPTITVRPWHGLSDQCVVDCRNAYGHECIVDMRITQKPTNQEDQCDNALEWLLRPIPVQLFKGTWTPTFAIGDNLGVCFRATAFFGFSHYSDCQTYTFLGDATNNNCRSFYFQLPFENQECVNDEGHAYRFCHEIQDADYCNQAVDRGCNVSCIWDSGEPREDQKCKTCGSSEQYCPQLSRVTCELADDSATCGMDCEYVSIWGSGIGRRCRAVQ